MFTIQYPDIPKEEKTVRHKTWKLEPSLSFIRGEINDLESENQVCSSFEEK